MKPRLSYPSFVTSGQFAYSPIFSIVLFSFALGFIFLNVVGILFSPYCFQRPFFLNRTANWLVSS